MITLDWSPLIRLFNRLWFATFGLDEHLLAVAELRVAESQRQLQRLRRIVGDKVDQLERPIRAAF